MKNSLSSPLNHEIIERLLKEGLERNCRFRLRVASQSMAPLLRPGDHVYVQKADPGRLAKGELVVLRRETDLAVHRLIAMDGGEGCLTKGDNLPHSDPPIPAADILGRVVAIEQGRRTIDLTQVKWVHTNRMLGTLNMWETHLVQFGRKSLKKRIPKKTGAGQNNQPGGKVEYQGLDAARRVSRLLRLPFRLLIRIVLGIAQIVP